MAGDGWSTGATSSQSIAAGDGYAEFTATETNKRRAVGLTSNTSVTSYQHISYGMYLGEDGTITIHEGILVYGGFGTYATGDKLRVAIEGGVVKYRKNGTLLRTSTLAPTYPLYAGGSIYSNAGTITNAVLTSGTIGSTTQFRWLVSDHLGTPRMIFDLTGSLANTKRHDYLPFGEELVPPTGGRTAAMGYASGDGVRKQFTSKERDVEAGLDYFCARYYSSVQGRFTSPDEFSGGPTELFDFTGVAAKNPTFYADLTHPQSLNKYQYAYNNPVVYIDPDGHQQAIYQRFMLERAPESRPAKAAREVATAVEGIGNGVTKEMANTYIDIYNGGATALGKPCLAYYEPKDKWEDFGMTVTKSPMEFSLRQMLCGT